MRRLSLIAAASLAPALLTAQMTQGTAGLVPVPATTLPLKHAPEPTAADISAKDLMTRLYIFSDDSMQGREAGTAGNVKGTNYIASEAKRIGLVPAGDGGTYFQTLPFKSRTLDPTSTFSAGGTPLKVGTDWVNSGPINLSKSNLQVVYGGAAGDSANMISPEQTSGKLVVFSMAPNASMRNVRAAATAFPNAAAMAFVLANRIISAVYRPSTFVDDPTQRPAAPATVPLLYVSEAGAAAFFNGPLGQLTPGTAGKTAALNVHVTTAPVAYPARNVIGILPGSDPSLKGEYVAIGAHNDHIGMTRTAVDHDSLRIFNHVRDDMPTSSPADVQAEADRQIAAWRTAHPNSARRDSISNGADDDGSGSISVLEIAQKMASLNPRPKRSIIFVWHVGEEKGLLGSEYFTDHPTVPRDSIVAQLNIDMIGRGDAWDMVGHTKEGAQIHGSPTYLQLVGSRRLSTELGDLVEQVNKDDNHGLTFDYSIDANGHPENIYCRSDHAEYARYGIPVVFFTTGLHSDYHQVTDEPEYIDYDHMARVANLVEDIGVHVANLDHRVVVDHPKPDPHAACRQ